MIRGMPHRYRPSQVLVACEFSGIVRDAFTRYGYLAVSCDLLRSESEGMHIQQDVRGLLKLPYWDIMIAHPPCRYLAVSGARWFAQRKNEQKDALAFVQELMDAPFPRICIENPVSVISSKIRKPDQIIQPWQFGEPEQKTTCLWLKNLPKLQPTKIVGGRNQSVWKQSPGPDRWKRRSRTFFGVADAMAQQWGPLLPQHVEY